MTLAWELENDASGPVYFSFPNTSLRASFSFPLAFARILRSAAGSSTSRNCSSASASWRTLSSSSSLMPFSAISTSHPEKSSDTRRKEYLLGPAVFDCDIAALDIAGNFKTLAERSREQHVLDLWFERVVKCRLRGEARLVRYIDDFVICFQYRSDALRVQDALRLRVGKFGLTLEPTKTKLVEFGRFAQRHAGKRGRNRPET